MAGVSSSAGPGPDSSKGKEPAAIDCDEDVPFKPHVLVVDDELDVCMAHKSLFEKHSCLVSTVEDSSDAMEVLGIGDENQGSQINAQIDTVDLVCTKDCMKHGMSGYELLKKIKESPITKDVPVVIVSTYDQDRVKKCMGAGAADFILKPLESADVKSLVKLVADVRGR